MARPFTVTAEITLYAESEQDAEQTVMRATEQMPGHDDTQITGTTADMDTYYDEEGREEGACTR